MTKGSGPTVTAGNKPVVTEGNKPVVTAGPNPVVKGTKASAPPVVTHQKASEKPKVTQAKASAPPVHTHETKAAGPEVTHAKAVEPKNSKASSPPEATQQKAPGPKEEKTGVVPGNPKFEEPTPMNPCPEGDECVCGKHKAGEPSTVPGDKAHLHGEALLNALQAFVDGVCNDVGVCECAEEEIPCQGKECGQEEPCKGKNCGEEISENECGGNNPAGKPCQCGENLDSEGECDSEGACVCYEKPSGNNPCPAGDICLCDHENGDGLPSTVPGDKEFLRQMVSPKKTDNKVTGKKAGMCDEQEKCVCNGKLSDEEFIFRDRKSVV